MGERGPVRMEREQGLGEQGGSTMEEKIPKGGTLHQGHEGWCGGSLARQYGSDSQIVPQLCSCGLHWAANPR